MKVKSRAQTGRPTGLRAAWSATTQAWFAPAAVALGLFNVVVAVGVASDGQSTMPGRVIGPAIMLGLGVAMFSGLWLRWRSRYSVGGPSVGGSHSPFGLGDVLIVAGVLPSLGRFWTVIPPIQALVVIAGVIGQGLHLRSRPTTS